WNTDLRRSRFLARWGDRPTNGPGPTFEPSTYDPRWHGSARRRGHHAPRGAEPREAPPESAESRAYRPAKDLLRADDDEPGRWRGVHRETDAAKGRPRAALRAEHCQRTAGRVSRVGALHGRALCRLEGHSSSHAGCTGLQGRDDSGAQLVLAGREPTERESPRVPRRGAWLSVSVCGVFHETCVGLPVFRLPIGSLLSAPRATS